VDTQPPVSPALLTAPCPHSCSEHNKPTVNIKFHYKNVFKLDSLVAWGDMQKSGLSGTAVNPPLFHHYYEEISKYTNNPALTPVTPNMNILCCGGERSIIWCTDQSTLGEVLKKYKNCLTYVPSQAPEHPFEVSWPGCLHWKYLRILCVCREGWVHSLPRLVDTDSRETETDFATLQKIKPQTTGDKQVI
jgi:hypothetical protein